MSASYSLEIGSTCQFNPSIVTTNVTSLSGFASGALQQVNSGSIVGLIIDLKNTNAQTNVFITGGPGSGPIAFKVETSDQISGFLASGAGGGLPTSGSFTDPTSGLTRMPFNFHSGGIIWVNSGMFTIPGAGVQASGKQSVYVNGAVMGSFPAGLHPVFNAQGGGGFNASSGAAPAFASGGGVAFAAFMRPHRFARIIALSGASTVAPITAGFLANLKTTGSGGGYSSSPGSGSIAV